MSEQRTKPQPALIKQLGLGGIVLTNKGFKVCFDICSSGLNVWTLELVVPSPLFGPRQLLYKLSLKYTKNEQSVLGLNSVFMHLCNDWTA